ncbi:ATP-binding protein [Kineosporia succinea]|nr:ATP-binding protein [Kineosporia succinea]
MTTFPELELEPCSREPIRTPGCIQPHGALMVLDPQGFQMMQRSQNLELVTGSDLPVGTCLTHPGNDWLEPLTTALAEWLPLGPTSPLGLRLAAPARDLSTLAHLTQQGVIVEFEPWRTSRPGDPPEALGDLSSRFARLLATDRSQDLAAQLVSELRVLTGFHRVVVYQFAENGDCTVLAEESADGTTAYLGLRFPARHVPAQARRLYLQVPVRQVPDVDYVPVPLEPELSPVDGQPLDLGAVHLRSTSDHHREFMRRMRTPASMSVSLVIDGELWGMVSCHHDRPRAIDRRTRTVCALVGQIASEHWGSLLRAEQERRHGERRRLASELAEVLSTVPEPGACITIRPDLWLSLTEADGVAQVTGDAVTRVGRTPSPAELTSLARFLDQDDHGEIAAYESSAHLPAPLRDSVTGLLAVSLPGERPRYLLWFRSSVRQIVSWAGEQRPRAGEQFPASLLPADFSPWDEEIHDRSRAWSPIDNEMAEKMRDVVTSLLLRQTVQVQSRLSVQLSDANRELESFTYSVAHDLRAPLRHISQFAERIREVVDTGPAVPDGLSGLVDSLTRSADWGGRLIDDLLAFARLGRTSLRITDVDLDALARSVCDAFARDNPDRPVEWQIARLPVCLGDEQLLMLALHNLVDNAIKYTAEVRPSRISIAGDIVDGQVVCTVSDNGIGFDMNYQQKVFDVFVRLHEDRAGLGTGIGLASVRRIIERHGGKVFANSEPSGGARIGFTLPHTRPEAS